MKTLKYVIGSIFISLGVSFFLLLGWFSLFGPEQYFVFDPYIDTQMGELYTPAKFEHVKTGMKRSEVESHLGQPLYVVKDTTYLGAIIRYEYTMDGKLRKSGQKILPFMCGDYAWYRSYVEFDTNDVAVYINKGWSYD